MMVTIKDSIFINMVKYDLYITQLHWYPGKYLQLSMVSRWCFNMKPADYIFKLLEYDYFSLSLSLLVGGLSVSAQKWA